jgi:hypothetical protein
MKKHNLMDFTTIECLHRPYHAKSVNLPVLDLSQWEETETADRAEPAEPAAKRPKIENEQQELTTEIQTTDSTALANPSQTPSSATTAKPKKKLVTLKNNSQILAIPVPNTQGHTGFLTFARKIPT